MSPWLKSRLVLLFGGVAFLGGATYLHAQNDYPLPAKTPSEAAIQFYQLLSAYSNDSSRSNDLYTETYAHIGSVSRTQMKAFSYRPSSNGLDEAIYGELEGKNPQALFSALDRVMNTPQYEARVAGKQGKQTIVNLSPISAPKPRGVVVIAEDGGYRVDLKATYGRWNNLSGVQLDAVWFRYTGETTPALRQDAGFSRAQCQSHLKQQMLGLMQYEQDYDEALPPASKWVDVVKPYVKLEPIFHCPALADNQYGYAYNQYLSQYRDDGTPDQDVPGPTRLQHYSTSPIPNPATTINIYEASDLGRNAFGPGTGRAYRHNQGWNLAFADGHVKWFRRDNLNGFQFKP